MKIAVVENENFFFPRGWRGISCFITSTTLRGRSGATGSTGNEREGRKKERNERIHAPVDRGKRPISLSLSLPPLSFFHYSRNVHLFAGLVDVAFSFQRLYAPTMAGRRTEVSIPSPSSIPFFPLFSTTAVHPAPPLTREKFHSSLVKLSHCPGLSLVSRGSSATGCPVIVRIT